MQRRRQLGPQLIDVSSDDFLRVDRVDLHTPIDPYPDRLLLVAFVRDGTFLERLRNPRDILDLQFLAGGLRQYLDSPDLSCRPCHGLAANLPRDAAAFDRTRRQVEAEVLDTACYILQRHVEASQHVGADFDPDLRIPDAGELDLAHAEVQQIVANPPRHVLQRHLRERPRDLDLADHVRVLELDDDGFLDIHRKRRDTRDRRLHVAQRLRHVGTVLEADLHLGHPGVSDRVDALHVVEKADLGLDRLDHVVFDVFGTRTGPLDIDRDDIEGKCGDDLPVQVRQAVQAEQHQQHHQQVARDLMRGEERDDAAALAAHCRIDTLEPGPASRSWVITIRSPSRMGVSPTPRHNTSLPVKPSTSIVRAASRSPSTT